MAGPEGQLTGMAEPIPHPATALLSPQTTLIIPLVSDGHLDLDD